MSDNNSGGDALFATVLVVLFVLVATLAYTIFPRHGGNGHASVPAIGKVG